MKRVLIIGNAPLPGENTKSRPAAGLRTHQFLQPLLGKRFHIKLVTIAMPECYDQEPAQLTTEHSDRFTEYRVSKNDPNLLRFIQGIHDEFHPDAIVSINTHPSYIISQIESRAPLWTDLNGWIIAEAQAQAYKNDSNDYIPHYYGMERSILRRADKVSVVSEAQRFCTYGELGTLGRLNKESFGYEFCHHIANGTEWFEGEDASNEYAVFKNVPEDAFVLLWVGGYNTWVDEVNLFKAVEDAMKKCPKLYFVSTGGQIGGLDNRTFEKFKAMISHSELRERFIFLGWVETKTIPYVYSRGDVGINVDRRCTETLTGARNRINEMMKFGLPVITTLGSEISYEVARAEAGIAVKSGKHELLTDAICSMYEEWHGGQERQSVRFKRYQKNGRKFIEESCNYAETVKPLLRWLENPRPAPDRNVSLNFRQARSLRTAFRYLRENGVKKSWVKFLQKVKR